jgi:hypothetical protein
LSGQIENDNEITDNDFNIIAIKYENLVNDCLFEDIPYRYKIQVAESFKDRYVPLQLNGTIGNNKRGSFKGEIVISEKNNVMV